MNGRLYLFSFTRLEGIGYIAVTDFSIDAFIAKIGASTSKLVFHNVFYQGTKTTKLKIFYISNYKRHTDVSNNSTCVTDMLL